MNVRRFVSSRFSCLASLSFVLCCCFWVLGNSFSSVKAANIDRITGPEAVQRMQQVLGDPQVFEDDMRASTQDFIADHFGSMAIAAAFGIAIRMRS